MSKSIKLLFRTPTPAELIVRELAEAQREKLEAETARDYAQSIVQYNAARIARLKDYEIQPATD